MFLSYSEIHNRWSLALLARSSKKMWTD